MEIALSFCIGFALSACSGFRVFIPLLIGNLGAKLGLIHLAHGFEFMGSTSASIILTVATVAEVSAYYVPFVDNLLDSIAIPTSFVAGTILTTSFLQINDPTLHWGLGLLAGGGVAGTIQAGTSLLRLGSTKFTGGLGNPIFATFENAISLIMSMLTLWLPMLVACLAVLLFVWILKKMFSSRKVVKL